MTEFRRSGGSASIALCALLAACAQTGVPDTQGVAGTGSGSSAASAAGASSTQNGTSPAGGATSHGGAGAGGDTSAEGGGFAAVDVSGRWAMIGWEDPVGVALSQNAGSITGTGCGVGTPPVQQASYCSDVFGTISADGNASFGFDFESAVGQYRYRADVTLAADGKRMAGYFGIEGAAVYPSAWLPVNDGEFWLNASAGDPSGIATGSYDLRLLSAEADDPRYVMGAGYRLFYSVERGIGGDLGAFFGREIVRVSDDLTEVGPVSPSSPELPVSLSLTTREGAFIDITARLSNGHSFKFEATRRP